MEKKVSLSPSLLTLSLSLSFSLSLSYTRSFSFSLLVGVKLSLHSELSNKFSLSLSLSFCPFVFFSYVRCSLHLPILYVSIQAISDLNVAVNLDSQNPEVPSSLLSSLFFSFLLFSFSCLFSLFFNFLFEIHHFFLSLQVFYQRGLVFHAMGDYENAVGTLSLSLSLSHTHTHTLSLSLSCYFTFFSASTLSYFNICRRL